MAPTGARKEAKGNLLNQKYLIIFIAEWCNKISGGESFFYYVIFHISPNANVAAAAKWKVDGDEGRRILLNASERNKARPLNACFFDETDPRDA